ncbi:regulator of G-protein signaling 8 isoform X1 [Arvicola amphibius]|uniref:regulator of G-protein signaling 8 isoform X1 n=1 Tax=Arvicola amphibius TaxID=1047088 RepID=UPI0018E37B48|nr:regulator of G-protein signaling 8 isoform X1 [Arvicola amphibius]
MAHVFSLVWTWLRAENEQCLSPWPEEQYRLTCRLGARPALHQWTAEFVRSDRAYPLLSLRRDFKHFILILHAGPWTRSTACSEDGVAAFRAFLKTEFSEENLEFWLACEEFKKTRSTAKLVSKAHRIFEEFVDVQAPREVNIDFQTREATRKNMQEPSLTCFDQAQGKVHSLMEKDSYPRFLRSKMYLDLLSQSQRRLS